MDETQRSQKENKGKKLKKNIHGPMTQEMANKIGLVMMTG